MSDFQTRVAIVGLGFGAEFIPIYQAHPLAQLHRVCQRSADSLRTVAERFEIPHASQHYQEVLDDPQIDLVHINTPIQDHAAMSIAALKAGKHVLCTVPMATTIEECEEICALVDSTGLRQDNQGPVPDLRIVVVEQNRRHQIAAVVGVENLQALHQMLPVP